MRARLDCWEAPSRVPCTQATTSNRVIRERRILRLGNLCGVPVAFYTTLISRTEGTSRIIGTMRRPTVSTHRVQRDSSRPNFWGTCFTMKRIQCFRFATAAIDLLGPGIAAGSLGRQRRPDVGASGQAGNASRVARWPGRRRNARRPGGQCSRGARSPRAPSPCGARARGGQRRHRHQDGSFAIGGLLRGSVRSPCRRRHGGYPPLDRGSQPSLGTPQAC